MWRDYEPTEWRNRIPPEEWGIDHWSTLMYAETRVVNYGGTINYLHMRCDGSVHEGLEHAVMAGCAPTRRHDGSDVALHDDYSCLEDMHASGLLLLEYWFEFGCGPVTTWLKGVFNFSPRMSAHGQNSDVETYGARVTLTDKGWHWASRLRKHLGKGGSHLDFSHAHATGLSEEHIRMISGDIVFSSENIDFIAARYGFLSSGVSLEQLRDTLRSVGNVDQCGACGAWFVFTDTYGSTCGECEEQEADLDDYEDEDIDYYFDDDDDF
jgi:hypothetical protein